MRNEEALEIAERIVTLWPRPEFTEPQLRAYTNELMGLPYEHTVRALEVAIRELKWRPGIPELWELVRAVRRAYTSAESDPDEQRSLPGKIEVPFWVKRWVAARWLFEQFGREQDMRPMREQGDWANPDLVKMPDTDWVEEAEQISDAQVWGAIGAERVRGVKP